MSEQRFVPGEAFDPSKPLIIAGAHLLNVQPTYPEIAQLVLMHPEWESQLFIIFPTREVDKKTLELVANSEGGVNHPEVLYRQEGKEWIVRAVVNYQVAYTAYVALYTYVLAQKRRGR